MKPVIIATRASALALAQANWTLDALRRTHPGRSFELLTLRTTGDKMQAASLTEAGASLPRGLFTKELEAALLAGEADLAVHSLKDLPTILPEGLVFAGSPEREDVRDVLVTRQLGGTLLSLPPGAVIGTSSTRRQAQLLALRPDLRVEAIRGNVGTRLAKLAALPDLGGTILALAGLVRLGMQIGEGGVLSGPGAPAGLCGVVLTLEEMLPAVGQAALGFEVRAGDDETSDLLEPLRHRPTCLCVGAERAFLRSMGGGCLSPIAAHATVDGDEMTLRAVSFLGGAARRDALAGSCEEPEELGARLAGRFSSSQA